MKASGYYFNRMDKVQQKAYHAIRTGLLELAPSCTVPRMEMADLSHLYFLLRLDCPEIFYAPSFTCRYYADASSMELIPTYLFQKGKVQEHRAAMEARVKKLIRPAQNLSPQEKLRYIHDFVCQNIRYDKLKKAYSHEIIGALGQGVSVCEGIAKAVKLLCDTLGIWCIVAISDSNPDKGIRYRHAWNIIQLNGSYYHLDATFDLSLSKPELIRHDYELLSDAQLFRDHEPVMYPVPACPDGDHFYYREQKLSFTKQEDVRKRAAQAAKKGRTLVFHWRGGYLTRQVLDELIQILQEEGSRLKKFATISLNWPQAVLSVSYAQQPPAVSVTWEEANEGESVESNSPSQALE